MDNPRVMLDRYYSFWRNVIFVCAVVVWTIFLRLSLLSITPTFPLLGPLGLIPFPSPWQICFGVPIHLPYAAEAANDSLLINRLVEEFRE